MLLSERESIDKLKRESPLKFYQSKSISHQITLCLKLRNKMKEEDVVAMQTEIEIMEQVDHPNIVKLKNVYEDSGHYCLIMELMEGGEVSDLLIMKP